MPDLPDFYEHLDVWCNWWEINLKAGVDKTKWKRCPTPLQELGELARGFDSGGLFEAVKAGVPVEDVFA